jgi:hypothetical protein
MELGLLLFVAFGLYLWARAHAKRAEERRALRWFTYTERFHGTNDPRLDWDVDFVDMQLKVGKSIGAHDHDPADPEPTVHRLVRKSATAWEMQMDDDWGAVPRFVVGPLEAQYQRFVLHWRD